MKSESTLATVSWYDDSIHRRHSREQELQSYRDPVTRTGGVMLSGVVDAGGQQQTDSDGELVSGNDGSSDLSGSHL
jgi:hypothetical protein